MNYLILIIVGVVGVGLGVYLGLKRNVDGVKTISLRPEQVKQKIKNKEQILKALRDKGRITNDEVERFLKVSNATAERYLDELEKEGKIEQSGKTGRSVFYTLI